MRGLYLEVPQSILDDRRHRGIDRFDEVWEGVYHMVPPPSGLHQVIIDRLFTLFSDYAARHSLGQLISNHGVQDPKAGMKDYRVPEWIFLRKGRERLFKLEESCIASPPDVVLEVRSPDDETDDKLPFYGRVGVREVLVVDRDSRVPEVLKLSRGGLKPVAADAEGWVRCAGLKAQFKAGPKVKGKSVLLVRFELDAAEHTI